VPDEDGELAKLSTKYRWNLQEWLRRMGVQLQGEQPPLRFDIQPVQIVGDASSLSSPLLAPLSWFGNTVLAAVGQFATVTLKSLAPGGSFIREERVTTAVNTDYHWSFGVVPAVTPTLIGAFQLTAHSMTPEDSTCVVTTGETAAVFGAGLFDNAVAQDNRTRADFDVLYLAPGREYVMQNLTSNQSTSFAYLVQDVPAMIPRN